ncbi:MAG: hypothetical protein JXD19_10135 [Deltaproteobacteria bacterium]|nr:hypothetical protein [Deltaproteobacteria bacterium]
MKQERGLSVATMFFLAVVALVCFWANDGGAAVNTAAPASPVKLIFIHHSCGENWLSDSDGGLGIALRDNNYYVSDTYYGWGPMDSIGDNTDIGHWWTWFRGENSSTYLQALYTESDSAWPDYSQQEYSRLSADPGGENEIIMFKSCYPNSNLSGTPVDAATTGTNSLRGEDAYSEHMTVGNAKGIYNDLLTYFATRQDKLFIAITAPPQPSSDVVGNNPANARAFNNWLVNDWLDNYPYNNVAVFDFFNVLTSNGGDEYTNDVGLETGNHHRIWNGASQHIQTDSNNVGAYTSAGDGHPSSAGNQKGTAEFVSLLNSYYNTWKGSGSQTHQYYVPYFTRESGYATGIGLSNCSSSQTAQVTITVYHQDGTVLGTETTTVAARGQRGFIPSAGAGEAGWLLVGSDQKLTGLCFVAAAGSGADNYMADIPMVKTTATLLHVPHVAQDGTWDTTVYVGNPHGTGTTVTLTYISSEGTVGATASYALDAMGSAELPLSDLLGSTTVSSGRVEITATQGVAAFALYTNIKTGRRSYAGISAVVPE